MKKFKPSRCAECGHSWLGHNKKGKCLNCDCKKFVDDDGMWIIIKKSGSWSMINYVNSDCSGGVYEQIWAMEEGLA